MAKAKLGKIHLLRLPQPDDFIVRPDKPDTTLHIGSFFEVLHRSNTGYRDTEKAEIVSITQEQWLLMAREPVEVENWMQ